MTRFSCLIFALSLGLSLSAQLYFPPIDSEVWDTMDPSELGYCPERIDSLYAFLDEQNTRSFLLLKDGRIVLEHYANGGSDDLPWYWASAGKSLTAYMVGIAQEQGLLDIHQPTSTYLGEGWTSMTPEQEVLITPYHQLTMTTGLADNDLSCLEPECLEYLVDPGQRWFYNSQGSRLLNDVLAEVTNTLGPNFFTDELLGNAIGMEGFWLDYVHYSTARDMARFGLLALNEGVWGGDTLLGDPTYLADMTSTATELNPAYGYLWWLAGEDGVVLPTLDFILPGDIIPSAPDDTYAALGKNDQKIYVSPSEGLVVVRQGEAAEGIPLGPSGFDEQIWARIMDLSCAPSSVFEVQSDIQEIHLWPNPSPSGEVIKILLGEPQETLQISLYDALGKAVILPMDVLPSQEGLIELDTHPLRLRPGLFTLSIHTENGTHTTRRILIQ